MADLKAVILFRVRPKPGQKRIQPHRHNMRLDDASRLCHVLKRRGLTGFVLSQDRHHTGNPRSCNSCERRAKRLIGGALGIPTRAI